MKSNEDARDILHCERQPITLAVSPIAPPSTVAKTKINPLRLSRHHWPSRKECDWPTIAQKQICATVAQHHGAGVAVSGVNVRHV
jgi:hypothetical protein